MHPAARPSSGDWDIQCMVKIQLDPEMAGWVTKMFWTCKLRPPVPNRGEDFFDSQMPAKSMDRAERGRTRPFEPFNSPRDCDRSLPMVHPQIGTPRRGVPSGGGSRISQGVGRQVASLRVLKEPDTEWRRLKVDLWSIMIVGNDEVSRQEHIFSQLPEPWRFVVLALVVPFPNHTQPWAKKKWATESYILLPGLFPNFKKNYIHCFASPCNSASLKMTGCTMNFRDQTCPHLAEPKKSDWFLVGNPNAWIRGFRGILMEKGWSAFIFEEFVSSLVHKNISLKIFGLRSDRKKSHGGGNRPFSSQQPFW